MGTLSERVEAIQAMLGDISERELARRSGLPEAAPGLLKKRFRDDPAEANVELDTLRKMAAGCGVRLAWLVTGEGPMRVVTDDRYPNRARALDALSDEIHPQTAERALSIQLHGADLPVSEWIADIKTLDRNVRREIERPGEAAEERAEKRRRVEDALDKDE